MKNVFSLGCLLYLLLVGLHQLPSSSLQKTLRSSVWPLPQIIRVEQKYRTYSPDPPKTHNIAQITFCGDFECDQPETLHSTKMLNLFLGKIISEHSLINELKSELSLERWINLTAYTASDAIRSPRLENKELAQEKLRAIGARLCQNKKLERINNNSATITFSLEHFEKPFTHSIKTEIPNRIEVQC